MTRFLRSLTIVTALVAVFVVPSVSLAQISTDSQVKALMSLGLAHPTTGKLLPGAIVDSTTVVGASVQSTDNTLNSVTLDDEMLALRGRGLLIASFGTLAANVNAKDIKLKVGGTAICTITGNAGNAVDFQFVAVLVETGVDAQSGFCWASVNGALVAASSINFTATVDANVAQAIITTGNNTAAAASAATGKGLVVVPLGGQ